MLDFVQGGELGGGLAFGGFEQRPADAFDPAAMVGLRLALEDALRELSRALDGHYIPSPLWSPPVRELLTAHPLGGCAMDADSREGVLNRHCEVHGYPDLFVVDGSIVPTSLARNPTATISALAERAAFHLLHGRELEPGDRAAPVNTWPEPLDALLAAEATVPTA